TDDSLRKMNRTLVTVSLTPFGRTGHHRHYKGSDAIANASGGFLYGQGDDTKGQCTAPSHLAYQVAACVAATLGLAGIRHARLNRVGQRIDGSLQEALTFTNSSSVARYTRENRLERRPAAKTMAVPVPTSTAAKTDITSISPPICRTCGESSPRTGSPIRRLRVPNGK